MSLIPYTELLVVVTCKLKLLIATSSYSGPSENMLQIAVSDFVHGNIFFLMGCH